MKTFTALVETYIEQGDTSQGQSYIAYQIEGREEQLPSNANYFLVKRYGEKDSRVIYSVSNLTKVELYRLLNSVGDIHTLDIVSNSGKRYYPVTLVNSWGHTNIFKESDLKKRLERNNDNGMTLSDYHCKENSISEKEYDLLVKLFGDAFESFLK